jgi:YHS domain-containing protein
MAANPSLKDPVCGTAVTVQSPHVTVQEGTAVYFCGAGCKAKFLASPANYSSSAGIDQSFPSLDEYRDERFVFWDVDVAGSNPVTPTTNFIRVFSPLPGSPLQRLFVLLKDRCPSTVIEPQLTGASRASGSQYLPADTGRMV